MQDTYRYPALFERCEDNAYTVTFPDLPGIVTEGDDIDEAVTMAKEALALHILGMESDGDQIPSPSSPDRLQPQKDSFYSLIEAYLPPLREKRANRSVNKMVTLPAWLKEEADRRGINVSQILQKSLLEHLGFSHAASTKSVGFSVSKVAAIKGSANKVSFVDRPSRAGKSAVVAAKKKTKK